MAVTLAGNVGTSYLNGAQVAQDTYPNLPTVTRTDCYIGYANWLSPAATNSANTYVDELAIFDHALTADDIARVVFNAYVTDTAATQAPTTTAASYVQF